MTTTETTDTSTTTDPSARNLGIVGEIYAAFGRGDVPYILDQLADDISWDEGIRATDVPWLQGGQGTAAVTAFFTAVGAGMQFTRFEPVSITAGGDHVVGIVREAVVAVATGATIPEDLYAHVWTFGADGKVTAFRHIGDFVTHETALGLR